ncbi:hypothetical protein NBRC116493_35870 [Aurantivibrio infirmus]
MEKTGEEQRTAYREIFKGRTPKVTLPTIGDSINKGWVIGERKIKEQIAMAENR